MNILPKKSWHVRNFDNILKVRRDEAEAAEEAKKQEERKAIAEREQRTNLLRLKARMSSGQPQSDGTTKTEAEGHFNFFQDAEEGRILGAFNKDHEAEKKQEQETYERKVGILTYLGQSATESQVGKPWYQKVPQRQEKMSSSKVVAEPECVDHLKKSRLDPLKLMPGSSGNESEAPSTCLQSKFTSTSKSPLEKKKVLPSNPKLEYQSYLCNGRDAESREQKQRKKCAKHKHSSKDKKKRKHDKKHKAERGEKRRHKERNSEKEKSSKVSIERLRAERLKREAQERQKTERFLLGETENPAKNSEQITDALDGRYNAQFNPYLARQTRRQLGDHFAT